MEGEGRTAGWGEGQDTRGAVGKVGEGEYRGGGGGGVGGKENSWPETGDEAWKWSEVGGPLGAEIGEGGFWESGLGAGIAIIGRGPVALPGGLLIMTGGEGGRGVKLLAVQTTDLEAGAGGGARAGGGGVGGAGCLRGMVA